MVKGGLIGLTALLVLTNGVSCYQTLECLDKYASIELAQQKREEERWIKGFPFDQIYNLAEGSGEKFAYWIYQKYLN